MLRPYLQSEQAKARIIEDERAPLFIADWTRPVFVHYAVPPDVLQRYVPFKLDLWHGMAIVSLVAFTMGKLRFFKGGKYTRWLTWPIREHQFLNVRTYVRENEEPGIMFINEFVNNALSRCVGPLTYGLPYRFCQMKYKYLGSDDFFVCDIKNAQGAALNIEANLYNKRPATVVTQGGFDEFVLERYTAYCMRLGKKVRFRIWHPPWKQSAVDACVKEDALLRDTLPWFDEARYVGAHYSAGAEGVWMGKPIRF